MKIRKLIILLILIAGLFNIDSVAGKSISLQTAKATSTGNCWAICGDNADCCDEACWFIVLNYCYASCKSTLDACVRNCDNGGDLPLKTCPVS